MSEFCSLAELKKMSLADARAYCAFLREALVKTVTKTGGHLASNLGVVEISAALCRVLDLEHDAVIYDTGHQCYVHKMLTGRGEAFATLRQKGGIAGFPRREESKFDAFGTGHSGTGVSAALGLSRAARLNGKKAWCAVVIGDGAFTGGEVFEALNNIRAEDRVIIILNDNGMSIDKSVGKVRGALNRMRTAGYYRFKDEVESALLSFPRIGATLARTARKAKNGVKRLSLPQGNVFEQLGLHYFGPADGNDLETVEFLLRQAMRENHSSILHLCTKKGKGYRAAEQDPCAFHGLGPAGAKHSGETFSARFGKTLTRLAAKDTRIVAITAAMRDGVGLAPFQSAYPHRFFDVGIAEEHGMTFAAGLAAGGFLPCFALYSTFFQRAYDQFLHDAALQRLPVVVALDRAGVTGEDGATHQGTFDLAITLSVPHVKVYAPASLDELDRVLERAFDNPDAPAVVRYPKGTEDPIVGENFPCRADIEKKVFGNEEKCDILFVSFGRTVAAAIRAAKRLSEKGISAGVVKFSMLKGFSEEEALDALSGAGAVVFVEEGVRCGGFSERMRELLCDKGKTMPKTKIIALPDAFVPHGSAEELLKDAGFSAENLEKEGFRLAET